MATQMPEIGAYDAKTHLPKLLERVQRGERFVITKHGKPVAELGPVTARDPEAIRKALERIKGGREALAKRGVRLSKILRKGESLRDLMHRGHRY
jgi:prevent-host-death family protein